MWVFVCHELWEVEAAPFRFSKEAVFRRIVFVNISRRVTYVFCHMSAYSLNRLSKTAPQIVRHDGHTRLSSKNAVTADYKFSSVGQIVRRFSSNPRS